MPAESGVAMQAERWQRIQGLAGELFETPADERGALLRGRCGDDTELRRDVERLLAADEKAGGFLSRPALSDLGEAPELPLPERVGPYRIGRRLHTGGMGEVYLAFRDDGELERRVAVKCIRGRLDSERLRRWFRAERQMLARLEHPKIARLYDGGTTEEGQPYLVMEYIEGLPLDLFCAHHRLTIRERLELVSGICEAVAHAHQNLLIHRDLKPGNILVTPEGEPKLLDFGIAKELAGGGEADLDATVTALHPLTPGYAAPEQIRGEPIRTTADVHALGILLWELLVGRRLFARQGRLSHQVAEAVCEEIPEAPSRSLCEPGLLLATEAGAPCPLRPPGGEKELRRTLAGDLDAIVLMALRKDPAERYPSVEALADDLRRHLGDRPVKAIPPSRRYRLLKTWQRHRLAITATVLVTLLILGFTGALVVQTRELARERDASDRALDFFTSIFEGATPFAESGRQLTVLQTLDAARASLLSEDVVEARNRAKLLDTLGQIYLDLGNSEAAESLLSMSLHLRQDLWPGEIEEARGLYGIGRLQLVRNDFPAARRSLEAALELFRRHGASAAETADTVDALADLLVELGHLDEALVLIRGSLARLEGEGDSASLAKASAYERLGKALRIRGRGDEAIAACRRAAEIYRRDLGEDHPKTLRTQTAFAALLGQAGRLEEAEALLRRGYELQQRILGPEHPSTLVTLHNLASNRLRAEDLGTAQGLFEQEIEERRGRADVYLAMAYYNLSTIHLRRGSPRAALAPGHESLRLRQLLLGGRHVMTLHSVVHLAEVYRQLGETERAFELAGQGLDALRVIAGDQHPVLYRPLLVLGRLHLDQGRLSAAGREIEWALAVTREHRSPDPERIAMAEGLLAVRHLRAGEPDRALDLLRRSREVLYRTLPPEDPRVVELDGYWQELASSRGRAG